MGSRFALLLLTSVSDQELANAAGVETSAITSIVDVTPRAQAGPAVLASTGETPLPELDVVPDEAPRRNLLRVEAARVDDAMERLSTLLVTRSRLSRAIAKLAASGSDTRELAQIAGENARQLRDLRSAILQVRMVALAEILERIPLMLRALTRVSGRQVRLETEAAGAELDKAVAERIFPALIHLVRNAVDHGIEAPDVRVRAGKPAEGVLRITCTARSDTRLELTIEDDGRGVDAHAVAARLHVPVPTSDAGVLELLCQPGFSTRDEATTTSGRGLGMDIVKRIVVDQLGGELSMHSRLGAGTRFKLQIPLTVAIIDGFVVECTGQRFIVPVSVVEEILDVDPQALITAPHGGGGDGSVRPAGMIERRGGILPLYALASLLGRSSDRATERRALVVRSGGEAIGFMLDAVLGQQEAVIRPLADPLVQVAGISAATESRRRPAHARPRSRRPRGSGQAPPAAHRGRRRAACTTFQGLSRGDRRATIMSTLHVVFKVAEAEYVLAAAEVLQMESYRGRLRVPGTAPYVAGVVQVRGRVVPVVDLRVRFGLQPITPTLDSRIVVAEFARPDRGAPGRQRAGGHQARPRTDQPPPRMRRRTAPTGSSKAVAHLGKRLLMLIDFAKVIGEEPAHGS